MNMMVVLMMNMILVLMMISSDHYYDSDADNGFRKNVKGNPVALRQSADAAVLLVANLNIRGVGNGDVNAIRLLLLLTPRLTYFLQKNYLTNYVLFCPPQLRNNSVSLSRRRLRNFFYICSWTWTQLCRHTWVDFPVFSSPSMISFTAQYHNIFPCTWTQR